jgi:hypothetical protein
MDRHFFLGDNGGRPAVLGTPRLLRSARRAGIRVLPGTDPLPLASHVQRVASYGFILPQHFELKELSAQVRRAIQELASQPRTFGACSTLFGFLRDQITLRLFRRKNRS